MLLGDVVFAAFQEESLEARTPGKKLLDNEMIELNRILI